MPIGEWSDIFDDSGDRKALVDTREVNLNIIERWVSLAEQVSGFADEYDDWRDLGFEFASIGEAGRSFFHRVSRTGKKYDQQVSDEWFSYWLKKHDGRKNIGSFIHSCKEAGLNLSVAPPGTVVSKKVLPSIPTEVYAQLPTFLQRCCNPFELAHERDTMLKSTLGVLSGCLPSVGGTYAQRAFGLNLFVFIIGPAASGKGTMMWAKRLAQPYHKRLIQESATAWEKYEAELAAYKAANKKEGNKLDTLPRPPARLLLYLPGNSTAAALLRVLAESKGRGIICETEADTLSNALRSDFGGFSDILRGIFQHEPVTMLRQADRLHIDLERPALSIVLTGTPGQLHRLIPSAEDGLTSRFLFYRFDQAPIWKDVSPNGGLALDPHFDALAKELDGLLETLPEPAEGTSYPVTITLTEADWIKVNAGGNAGLQEAWQEVGDSGASTAKRLGLIAWRIAGILTVLRYHERGLPLEGELVADSRDVATALTIMDIARAHALAVLEDLPVPHINKSDNNFAVKAAKRTEAVALRAQGVSLGGIATRLGVAKSTVQDWCK